MVTAGDRLPDRRWARTRFVVGLASLTLLTATCWLALWASVVPLVRGWSSVAVTSGSMAPLIDEGDVVVAAPYQGQALEPGTVIVFDNPAGTGTVTHRVVDTTPAGAYVTQGDANGRIDSTPVAPRAIRGVGRILVPEIGTPFVWADHRETVTLSMAGVVLFAGLWAARWALLARFNPWRHKPPPPVQTSVTTIGLILGIWPTPDPAVAHADSHTDSTPRRRRGPQRLAVTTSSFALVAGALVVAPGLIRAQAAFTNSPDNSANSWSADVLSPPTGLSAVANGSDIDLSWTATPDLYADGYDIYRGTTSGGPYAYHDSVAGQSTTNYTDVGANAGGGTLQFESVATGTNNGSSVVITKPSGTVDGDLLIATVSGEDDAAVISPPAGWTQIHQTVSPGGFMAGAWYRIAGSEPASFTFTSTVSHAMNASVLRYSGADQASPIDVSGVATASGNPTAPDVTTTVADAVVLRVGSLEDQTVSDIDYPAGTNGRVEVDISPGQVTGVADEAQAVPGSTGTAAFTGTTDDYIAATIALAPATGTGPDHYYVVRSYYGGWESIDSNEASPPPAAALIGTWLTGLTHASAADTDRVLVFVASNEQQTTSTPTLTSVTYGGQSLTKVIADEITDSFTARLEVWILDEAGIAVAADSTFVPSWSAAPDNPLYSHAFFANVDQASPTGATATATNSGDTPNPIPIGSVATSTGDMVIVGATAGETGDYTPQNGFLGGTNEDTTVSGTTTLGTAYKSTIATSETATMLFNSDNPPLINRQIVISVVIQKP